MGLPVLPLPIDNVGYTVSFAQGALSSQVRGGRGKYRRDVIGSSELLTVRWVLTPSTYQFLISFIEGTLEDGTLPFITNIVLREPYPEARTVNIIPGTVKLVEQRGLRYVVTADIEALRTVDDDLTSSGIAAIYLAWSPNINATSISLTQLVNINLNI